MILLTSRTDTPLKYYRTIILLMRIFSALSVFKNELMRNECQKMFSTKFTAYSKLSLIFFL